MTDVGCNGNPCAAGHERIRKRIYRVVRYSERINRNIADFKPRVEKIYVFKRNRPYTPASTRICVVSDEI